MNAEKLKRLQAQVRIGGKGTPRRKKKVTHQTAATDDKKLQSSLKKLSVSTIPGIEEVNIIKDDLTVIHFNNPKAQASLSANTFAVTGHGETKKVVEMLPEILPQLGQETVVQLRMFANSMTSGQNQKLKQANSIPDDFVDDVPLLVEDFDQIAKQEASKESKAKQNTKSKIKSKDNAEDQTKQDKSNEEAKLHAVDQTQQESQSAKPKEKQGKQSKKPDIEKPEKDLEASKEELPEGQTPSTASKDQKKENKKDTKGLTGEKNAQKQEGKKTVQTHAKNKGVPKETTKKESQQPNKKNQQDNTNKNTQESIAHDEVQKSKKSQIENNRASIEEKALVETAPESVENKEEKAKNTPKESLDNRNLDQAVMQTSEEKINQADVKPLSEDSTKLLENSAVQDQKISKKPPVENIQPTTPEQKAPIKDLALPIPPIIPLQTIVTGVASSETAPKVDAIPLEFTIDTNSNKAETSKEINVTDVVIGDTQTAKPQDNNLSEQIAPSKAFVEEETQISESIVEVTAPMLNSELPKVEESDPKDLAAAVTSAAKTINENPAIVVEATKSPQTPPLQKAPGAAKPQSNRKQPISKELKPPAPQQQKKSPDSRKPTANTEVKKDIEGPKAKPTVSKPQPSNNNKATKPQPAQQQQVQKTPTETQTNNSKPNEKPVTTPKPTIPMKTAPVTKKTGVALPVSPNPKPDSPPHNKNKANPTATKPKQQAPNESQKTSKPRPNLSSTVGSPQTKTTEKPVTSPTADEKSTIRSQAVTKQ